MCVHLLFSFTQPSVFSKVEDALDKSPTAWSAGGPDPTMAGYTMSFGLEAVAANAPNMLGPKTKLWVDRVHEQYALCSRSLSNTHPYRNSETRLLIDPP